MKEMRNNTTYEQKLYLGWYISSYSSKRLVLNLVCSPVLLTVKRKEQKLVLPFVSLVTVWYPARKIDCRSSGQYITHPFSIFKSIREASYQFEKCIQISNSNFPRRQIHLVARMRFTPSTHTGKFMPWITYK